MTMPYGPPGSGWAITSQRQAQQQTNGQGVFVQGVEVTFLTQYNTTASIFVPYNQYTPAGVQAAVTARATQLDQVAALTADTAL